jgi:hypothetical protein
LTFLIRAWDTREYYVEGKVLGIRRAEGPKAPLIQRIKGEIK